MNDQKTSNDATGLEIAVVGLAGRFPGAKNTDAFWRNLQKGVESISFFTDEELAASGVDADLLKNPHYVKARGVLGDIEFFDASFFNFAPREAQFMDPQQRIFLECAYEALENAGYDPGTFERSIGVYAGAGVNTYFLGNLYSHLDLQNLENIIQISIANSDDHLATQAAYRLNLKGPGVTIQTACSTSLVAVHMACQGLLSGDCDMALAGGVSIFSPEKIGYLYQEGGIASPDGHCRVFDAQARGTVAGNGVGLVVLKRLKEAVADEDCIYAVIKGSAINNDGSLKVGYTAPGIEGQKEVIRKAHVAAGIAPETITYIEAHGTGTTLGDPIEIEALSQVFQASTNKKCFCAIGSVKSNIGHLDAAAGIAGLIKTVLALYHKALPPSLHFEEANPKITFVDTPFYVNTRFCEWNAAVPRRAGVSSFGIGGTNAHVILEEAPAIELPDPSRSRQLLVFSAKTTTALEAGVGQIIRHFKNNPDLHLPDAAYTLQVGRRSFTHRRVLVCQDPVDAAASLETQDPTRVLNGIQERPNDSVIFMFSGQGSQTVNMALELYQNEPVFRTELDRCAESLSLHLGYDLRQILYPPEAKFEQARIKLEQTQFIQPALFALEYSLAKLWISWGVRPKAMIGHGIGEYVAACLSGVFTREQALALVAQRGRILQQLPKGSMLSVLLSETEIASYVTDPVALAAVNGPKLCTLSGPDGAIEKAASRLQNQGISCRWLRTSHAFHSKMVEAALEGFRACVQSVSLQTPKIPFVSNVTGNWITKEEAIHSGYWVKHMRATVKFAAGIATILQEPDSILLEVGPGHDISVFAKQQHARTVVNSLPGPDKAQDEQSFLLNALGRLWLAGVPIDWKGFYAKERRRRIPLPTYAFERSRYWIEPSARPFGIAPIITHHGKKEIGAWFHVPSWKRSFPANQTLNMPSDHPEECFLVFADECGLGVKLAQRLERKQNVMIVKAGDCFTRLPDRCYMMNPMAKNDYERLFKELAESGRIPKTIIHLWNVTAPRERTFSAADCGNDHALTQSFYSLLFLSQVIGKKISEKLKLVVVSNRIHDVTGEEKVQPEKALALGPCRVIPQEYPHISCCNVDIIIPEPGGMQEERVINQLLAEINAESIKERIIAYRGNHRWVQTFESMRLDPPAEENISLRKGGVYLITGGLGGMGLEFAGYLAKIVKAKLILIGRSIVPPKKEWEKWLLTHDDPDITSKKIKKLMAMEAQGAQILVFSADVTDHEQMHRVIEQSYGEFGTIHGVIHAAGVAGGGMIELKTSETANKVLAPKVKGTLVLNALIQDRPLDFFVLCSSMNSLLGGIGQVDYSAANAFLDAFAHYHFIHANRLVVAVNWSTWREVGMAVSAPTPLGYEEQKNESLKEGISPREGIEAFGRILVGRVPQIIVSATDLQAQIEQGNKTIEDLDESKKHPSYEKFPRPALKNAYLVPRTAIEKRLVNIWEQLLGVAPIGIHDPFFDLGGHSLLATQILSRVKDAFQLNLSLNNLFELPTVAQLAEFIENNRWAAQKTNLPPDGAKKEEWEI